MKNCMSFFRISSARIFSTAVLKPSRVISLTPSRTTSFVPHRAISLPPLYKTSFSTSAPKMSPIPTIIIGRTPKIASKVREGLLPEYDGTSPSPISYNNTLHMQYSDQAEVIHVILSMEQGMKDLPVLLSNPSKTPEHTEGNLGSGKYGTRPLVVGVGGGFDDEMFEKMRDACEGCDEGVVWVSSSDCVYSSRSYRAYLNHRSESIKARWKACRVSATQTRMAPRLRSG
jgi:hypothetical protein